MVPIERAHPPRPDYADEVKAEAKRMYEGGETMRGVSELTGVPVATLGRWLRGAKKRPPVITAAVERRKGQRFTTEDRLAIYRLVIIERQDRKAVARLYNSDVGVINNILGKDGVGHPDIQEHARQRKNEMDLKSLERRIEVLDKVSDLPMNNWDQAARAYKSLTPEVLPQQAGQSDKVLTAMDVVPMLRKQAEEIERLKAALEAAERAVPPLVARLGEG